jgi:hypothetical protein
MLSTCGGERNSTIASLPSASLDATRAVASRARCNWQHVPRMPKGILTCHIVELVTDTRNPINRAVAMHNTFASSDFSPSYITQHQPNPLPRPSRPPLGMPKNSNQSPTFKVVGTIGPPYEELLYWSSLCCWPDIACSCAQAAGSWW